MKSEVREQGSYHEVLPNHISDEAAFVLSEFLNTLALTCDEKYFTQLRRHAEQLYPPQLPGFVVERSIDAGDDDF